MFKRITKITRDYLNLISFKDKYLIVFTIVDIINVLISLLIPYFISLIVENITNKLYFTSIKFVLALGLTYIINRLGSYCTNWCYANFFKEAYVKVNSKLVNCIYNFDEEFAKKLSLGKIINTANEDIVNIAEIPSFIIEWLIEIIKLIIIYYVFANQNALIAFYVFFINIIYYKISSNCNIKNIYYLRKQRNYADKITGMISQILNGLKDIKSFGFHEKIDNKLNVYRKKWKYNYFMKRKYFFTRKTIVGLIIDFGKIAMYIFLLIFLVNEKISIALFILIVTYYDKSKEAIDNIMSFESSILQESVSLYRIEEIINYGKNNTKSTGEIFFDDIVGRIEFRNVFFKYNNKLTLKNISFVAEPNQVTSIVGKTGAGKTSIFNILLRLYKIDKGKVLIDSVDIKKYANDVYKSNISIVNQKTFIFNMSIRANLSLVDSNKKRQIEMCKKVGIHDFVMSLPKGYNTILKEDASNISGGQKQLLSLVRALLTKSEIILLDEVTSSVDPSTTKHIINLLNELKLDHTIVTITHNKDIMKVSDKIIVLNDGKIVGIGDHSELIKNNDTYKNLQI